MIFSATMVSDQSRGLAVAESEANQPPPRPQLALSRGSGRVPPDFDDVTVRVAELDAHIVRLIAPPDNVEPVRVDAIPKGAHFVRAGGTATEVQERRQDNRVIDLSQRE